MKAFSFLLENLELEDLEGDDRMKVTKVDDVGNILKVVRFLFVERYD